MLVFGVAADWGWFRMSERPRCPGSNAGARAPGLRNAAKADPKPASASPEAPVGGGLEAKQGGLGCIRSGTLPLLQKMSVFGALGCI